MPEYIEKEGEVLPSYTGVNQPKYPKYSNDPAYDFPTAPKNDPSELTLQRQDTGIPADVDPAENRFWPDEDEKRAADRWLPIVRGTLENHRPPDS